MALPPLVEACFCTSMSIDTTTTQHHKGTTKLTDEEKIVGRTLKSAVTLTEEELASVNSRPGLVQLLSHKNVDVRKALVKLRYEQELQRLQVELVQLQRDVQINGRRVAILFEGRDAAGKGGTIRRFMEHLNPRTAKIAARAAPTETEKGQWYFQRYQTHLPNPG
jgi:polyphosphate kinase 2 (PPK2 family)